MGDFLRWQRCFAESLIYGFLISSCVGEILLVDTDQKRVCEPKVLDDIPPDPFYDASDYASQAAKKLADFLVINPHKLIQARERANTLAKEALKEDEGLLAVALGAPSLSIAVVQFRDAVTIPANHSALSAYWRELGVAWNQSDGTQLWSAPFRDCGALHDRWLWPFSVTLISHGYKVVATAFIAADVDQCNDALEPIFGRKHSCDRDSTFCLMSEADATAPRGKYTCICKEGFYIPNETIQGFQGEKIEASAGESASGNFSCIPCPGACFCDQNGNCLFGDPEDEFPTETLLKAVTGAILGACMLCCLVLSVLVFRQRKCKTIASGMWTILETILFGIFLLYCAVAIHFVQVSNMRCLLEIWCRELGFIISYGAIVLKLYRHLVEFRTRKAHRWVVRDLDLLRYLLAMIVAVLCYLAAFTASCMDFLNYTELFELGLCKFRSIDYVTQCGELLILGFGLQIAFVSRNANTQFRERQFLVASISIELIVSSTFYILKALYLDEFNPSALFLALFVRSQLTNSVTLGLVFAPKLWYQHKQFQEEIKDSLNTIGINVASWCCVVPFLFLVVLSVLHQKPSASTETAHHHGPGVYAADPEVGDCTISEMSPEDIRAELKRLYTQLEVLKNKTLRQDNPHISKRRGGRKKVAHRRFSLQALSSKHRRPPTSTATDMEVTEAEPSREEEEEVSVCSVEPAPEISGVTSSK